MAALCFFYTVSARAAVRNVQDNAQVVYHVTDDGGDPVAGKTVEVKIKRVSDGQWYDFDDDSFKAAGWGNKSADLSEDATEGFYYYTFNPPASETSADQYQFLFDIDDPVYGDHQSIIVPYQDIGVSDFDVSGDQVTVATNNDKTGYSVLSVSDKTGYSLAADQGGVTVGNVTTVNDKTGYSISGSKTTLDALNDISAADVWAAGTRTLTELDEDNTTIDLDSTAVGSVTNATGDWNATEKAAVKAALGVTDDAANVTLDDLGDATDGDKESGNYTGIEQMIRVNR